MRGRAALACSLQDKKESQAANDAEAKGQNEAEPKEPETAEARKIRRAGLARERKRRFKLKQPQAPKRNELIEQAPAEVQEESKEPAEKASADAEEGSKEPRDKAATDEKARIAALARERKRRFKLNHPKEPKSEEPIEKASADASTVMLAESPKARKRKRAS